MQPNAPMNNSPKNAVPSYQAQSAAVPHSLDAERMILGNLLFDNDQKTWSAVSDILLAEDFYTYAHRAIFETIQELYKRIDTIDLISLREALTKKQLLDKVGGESYLYELASNTARLESVAVHAKIVRDNAILRHLIGTSHDIVGNCYATQGRDVREILDEAEQHILNIAKSRISDTEGPKNVTDVLDSTLARIQLLYNNRGKGEVTGLATGFTDLDKMTTGFHAGDLIILGARPSMGKTTFAMNICEYAALKSSKPVLVFSLEMPSEQLMTRSLASLSGVPQSRLRTGNLTDEDLGKVMQNVEILQKKAKLYIDDTAGLTPTELRSRARRIAQMPDPTTGEPQGLGLIMVDYLQLMRVPNLAQTRHLEVAEISRSLKALAKELNVPVLALAQLNRDLEGREDKRPRNADLRESGSIEQDADIIMFVHREDRFNKEAEKNKTEIIIGKQRNGPTGTVYLTFQNEFSRFVNCSTADYTNSHY